MSEVTKEKVHEIANQVAKATVEQLFLSLGVNTDDPEAILAMQKDFAHVRMWRESTDMVKRNGLAAAVTFVVTGAFGYLVFLFSNHR